MREEKEYEAIKKTVVYSDTKYKHFKSLNNFVKNEERGVLKC